MIRTSSGILRFLLPAALFLCTLFSLFPREITVTGENSENALSRLIEISDQLSALNAKLQNELQDSRKSSRELQNMLESSKLELDILKQELERLRITSAELLYKAENSQTESTGLTTALKKAESSLLSLELSFEAYRRTAERKISSLENQNKFWKIGCIAAGVLAAGLGTVLAIGK